MTAIKLIEADKIELRPGAKYVILLSPPYQRLNNPLYDELTRLIGDNFTIVPMEPEGLKVYEVAPHE